MTEEDRFMSFVIRSNDSDCWNWSGSIDGGGYGGFRRSKESGGKWIRAHRVSYELFVGPIPSGRCLDHLCRVRSCVNPKHLEPVTIGENCRRGLTGINSSSKTHCPKGHPYSGDNLYINTYGKRECRSCIRSRSRARRRCKTEILPS